MNQSPAPELQPRDLWDLETYAQRRVALRREVMAIKARRRIAIGDHLTLCFENRDTIFYQVMEMLRIENISSREGIDQELAAYNPLISGGGCLRATLLIEYEEAAERRLQLRRLKNMEDLLWRCVGDGEKAYAQADEDMQRSNEEKTSAVHFLRYSFAVSEIEALTDGAKLVFGCDHPQYRQDSGPLPAEQLEALLSDLRQ